MNHTAILGWVTFVYLGAAILYWINLMRGGSLWEKLATLMAIAGLVAQTAALGLRWAVSYEMGIGHAPLSNFYESLIFFSWAVVAFFLFMAWRTRTAKVGAFVLPIAFISMAYASLSPAVSNRIQPLIPALKSNWLIAHVVTCFLGYAAFAVAFGTGIIFLLKEREESGKGGGGFLKAFPEKPVLDELIYQSAFIGFVIFTVGIMTGSVWAHYAWGSYWSWDPKETWSLITWIVYAAMLHARSMQGWRGKRMAWLMVLGFVSVLFTFFGVNYLSGLHSYLG